MEIVELQQNLEMKRNIDYGFLPPLFVKVKQKTFLKDSKKHFDWDSQIYDEKFKIEHVA